MTTHIPFPSDSGKITVEVFYQKGDPAFVCGAHGPITAGIIEDIEKDFADNPDEGFIKGDGTYLYIARWVGPQVGDRGRVELPGYWDLEEVGFRPMDDTAGYEFWVPEAPSIPGHYALPKPRYIEGRGKLGEKGIELCTRSIHEALRFSDRESCMAWIEAQKYNWVAVEHGWMDMSNKCSPHLRYDLQRRCMTRCQANDDGDCRFKDCPQLRDNEPASTGRHCPNDCE